MKSIKKILEKHKQVKRKIDKQIKKNTISNYPLIDKPVSDLLIGGGKRLRPLMTILSARIGGKPEKNLYKLAAGIEILHMATLFHDDVIDEAQIRRGENTAHNKFGKKVAIFTGDFLLSKVYNLFVKYSQKKTMYKLSKIINNICEGEIDQFQNRFNIDITLRKYLHRIRKKTALLYGYSAFLGGYEIGLRNKKLFSLYNVGLNFGMAFQIQDDILDFKGKKELLGKEIGQDIKSGIYTLPVIILLQQKNSVIKNILNKSTLTKNDLKYIYQKVNYIGLKESKNIMNKFIKKANQYLDYFPESKPKNNLNELINSQELRKL